MGMCGQRGWDRNAMPCRPHTWDREGAAGESERSSAAAAPRDPAEHVTDVDRERAAAVLSEAFRDGMLRVEEFDQRLSAVYAAQTVGDLDGAMSDLHPNWLRELDEAEAAQRRARRHRREWEAGLRTYLGVMALLVGIWLFTNLGEFAFMGGDGDTYFWPIWPILGWGIPLYLSRPRRRDDRRVTERPMAGVG